jgi:hypothetical protein
VGWTCESVSLYECSCEQIALPIPDENSLNAQGSSRETNNLFCGTRCSIAHSQNATIHLILSQMNPICIFGPHFLVQFISLPSASSSSKCYLLSRFYDKIVCAFRIAFMYTNTLHGRKKEILTKYDRENLLQSKV